MSSDVVFLFLLNQEACRDFTISYFFFFLEFGVHHAFNQPFHAAEGGLGAPDEVAVTGDHQLTLLSVVTRNVGGFPVASGRNRPAT